MSCHAMLFDPSYFVFQPYFGPLVMNSCKPVELCVTTKNGFINLTPLRTLLLALGGRGVDGPVFCVVNKVSDALRRALRIAFAVRGLADALTKGRCLVPHGIGEQPCLLMLNANVQIKCPKRRYAAFQLLPQPQLHPHQ